MPRPKPDYSDVKGEYSPGGLPRSRLYPQDLTSHRSKGGGDRERVVTPGRTQGPAPAGKWQGLLNAIGTLDAQVDEIPVDGEEHGSRIKIAYDPQGRSWLCWKVYKSGRTVPEWYCVKGVRTHAEPDFEIPDGGGINVGGAPAERPIIASAGALTIPTGSTATSANIIVSDSEIPVKLLPQAGTPTLQFQTSLPHGYNLGPMNFRIYFQAIAGTTGTHILGVRAKVVPAGVVPAFSGPFVELTETVAADGAIVTPFSANFTPVGTPARGDSLHFEIRRNGGTDPSTTNLERVFILYARDRFTDAVS